MTDTADDGATPITPPAAVDPAAADRAATGAVVAALFFWPAGVALALWALTHGTTRANRAYVGLAIAVVWALYAIPKMFG